MRRFLSLFIMLMLCGMLAFAQSRVVSGRIIDATGNAVPFASVKVKGSKTGVAADGNGTFSIKIKDGDLLEFSASGYKPSEVNVGTLTNVITILSRNTELTEVIVTTALNQRTKSTAIGYSVASIKNDELNRTKVVNVANGLTGKVSGLNIQSVSSDVFGETRITLRGIRSLTGNNQPLLVVDGVPMSLDLLSSLSANDVADISVLKSNSAATLYGQDGANGAILVTTKRGARTKPVINVGTTVQFDNISFYPKLQNEYGTGETEDVNGQAVYDRFTNNSFGPKYNGSMVELGAPLENGQQQMVKYADLGKERFKFFNTGLTVQYDVSIAGGDDKSRYYLSAQDAKIDGIMPKDKNRRTSFRFNASREFNKLTTSFNVNYVLSNYDVVFQNRGDFGNIYSSVIKTGSFVPLTSYKDWKNNPYATPDGYYNYFGENPYMLIDIDRRKGRRDDIIASTDLNYKFNNNFTFTYRLGTTVRLLNQKSQQGAITYSAYAKATKAVQDSKAEVFDKSNTGTRISSEAFLNFRKNFGKISVDALAGISIVQRNFKEIETNGKNLVIPTLFNVSNRTGEPNVTEFNYIIRTTSLFGKATFGFDNKLFIEVSGRNDKDSRLPKDGNSFFYPGVNGSIVFNEIFPQLKNGRLVSLLKLRGGIAKSGNVNLGGDYDGAYQLSNAFGTSGVYPYGNLPGYTAGNQLKDPKIRPEFVVTKEIGLELGLLKNKIGLEVTAYQQDNTDQVIAISLPRSTGYTSSLINAASFTNKGIEFDLRLTPLLNLGKFRIDVKTNLTYQTNKVNTIYQDLTELTIGNSNVVTPGKPAYLLKLTDFRRDPDGRVIIDRVTGNPSADPTPKLFGNTLPKYIFGINPSVSYGGLSISALVEHRSGNFIYNDIGGDLVFNGIAAQTTLYDRKPYVFPNSVYLENGKYVPNTSVTTSTGNANYWATSLFANNVQSLYYTSADFWKLREVSLSYVFPESVLKGQNIFKAASIAFVARNVALWVPSSNQYTDPEFSNNGTNNAAGVNSTTNLPPTRTLGINLNFTF
jgi:TonB-linked SusC/RagA family outer membrane protein